MRLVAGEVDDADGADEGERDVAVGADGLAAGEFGAALDADREDVAAAEAVGFVVGGGLQRA